jgi:hypothetical protein
MADDRQLSPPTGKGPVRYDTHGASCGKSATKGELTMSAQKRRARGTSDACPLCKQGGSDLGQDDDRPLGRKRREGGKNYKKKLTLQGVGRTGVDDRGGYRGRICWGRMLAGRMAVDSGIGGSGQRRRTTMDNGGWLRMMADQRRRFNGGGRRWHGWQQMAVAE